MRGRIEQNMKNSLHFYVMIKFVRYKRHEECFDLLSAQLYLNQTMECPLQNMRLIQSIKENQHLNVSPLLPDPTCNTTSTSYQHSPVSHESTPSFVRYPSAEKYEETTLQSNQSNNISSLHSHLHGSSPSNELCKYLQDDQNEEQAEPNDYSFQINELKSKLIAIQQISQQEIVRLKQELQLEKGKYCIKNESVSVGVNTDHDHKDDEIIILKEMLRQQCALNKQLLQQSIKIRQNIYEGITITKN